MKSFSVMLFSSGKYIKFCYLIPVYSGNVRQMLVSSGNLREMPASSGSAC